MKRKLFANDIKVNPVATGLYVAGVTDVSQTPKSFVVVVRFCVFDENGEVLTNVSDTFRFAAIGARKIKAFTEALGLPVEIKDGEFEVDPAMWKRELVMLDLELTEDGQFNNVKGFFRYEEKAEAKFES
jgi:hypothetical protein